MSRLISMLKRLVRTGFIVKSDILAKIRKKYGVCQVDERAFLGKGILGLKSPSIKCTQQDT